MTLFFDGIPSSGGPRCLGWRGVRGLLSAYASPVWSRVAASFVFVMSSKGWCSVGALVGPSPLYWRYQRDVSASET